MNQTTQKLNISLTYNFKNRIAWMNYIEITKIKNFASGRIEILEANLTYLIKVN